MDLDNHWLSASAVLALLASLAVGHRIWRLYPFPGRTDFIFLLLAQTWWTTCFGLEYESAALGGHIFWSKMAWLGIVATPGFWALFIWNYTQGQLREAPRFCRRAIVATSLLVWGIALTNDLHHLIYTDITLLPASDGRSGEIHYAHAPTYFLITAAAYLEMLLAETLIFYSVVRANGLHRSHYVSLAIASLFPWLGNVLYLTGVLPYFDPTPFGLVITNCTFYWLMSRRHMFDLLPIAHSTLFDVIPDPIFVVDSGWRIAECNAAARRLAGGRDPVGETVTAIEAFGDSLAWLPLSTTGGRHETIVGTSPPRCFDVGQQPLSYAGRSVGRLLFLRDVTHRKDAEEQLQSTLAELETQLQTNMALQQQLREQAIRDALTGLHNRRFLDELAPVLLADAERSGQPLVAAMIDIDHFKLLNDTYGHSAGDMVLRATGMFLRENTRQGDAVFRMGGEEFLILLPHTEAGHAMTRIDAWRESFMEQCVPHDGVELKATFSAGVALHPTDAAGLKGLLRCADQALYRAKLSGRNRIMRWHPELLDLTDKI